MALIPNTSEILAILDPITFPIAISLVPFNAALTLTRSSGADVPKATTVKPINPALKPSLAAIEDAPSTKNLPPRSNIPRPDNNIK